jgi:nucleotide-binding universal stress UspA family protein
MTATDLLGEDVIMWIIFRHPSSESTSADNKPGARNPVSVCDKVMLGEFLVHERRCKMTPRKRMSVLLADDGSQHAQSAVALLQEIPLPPKSRITVLRAFTAGQIPWVPEFERSLDRTKGQLLSEGFQVETQLQLGSAAEKIIEMAAAKKSDLIVLGAKGLRATAGILLGGVAQQVVEYAYCPVLVVRAPYRGLRRILHVTDGSPFSQNAARCLVKFPLPEDIDVRVMHVLPPEQQLVMMEPYMGEWQTVHAMPATDMTAMYQKQRQKGEALLKRTSSLLQRHGIESTSVLVRGDAATEIIEYAKAHEIDLIVAGSRGLSQIRGWWMGSVSRKLVHYSTCSVLIVKGLQKGAKPWK